MHVFCDVFNIFRKIIIYKISFKSIKKDTSRFSSGHTKVVPKVPDLTKKTQKIWEKIFLFFNIVSFQLDTLFPAIFNNFDTLFIVRTVEHLKIAINRRFHLFIVGKSFTTEPFFQVWKKKIRGG